MAHDSVAHEQRRQAEVLRTRFGGGLYDRGIVSISEQKRPVREVLENRIRAHLRAAMVENGKGLNETARLLVEDAGAITRTLQAVKPRAPSAYLALRISQVFGVKLVDLFNEDPAAEYFEPGTPRVGEPRTKATRRYPITPSSDASRGPAKAGRHRTATRHRDSGGADVDESSAGSRGRSVRAVTGRM